MNQPNSFWRIVMEQKVAFAVTFFVIFTVLYGILFALDFLPEPPTETTPTDTSAIAVTPVIPEPVVEEIPEPEPVTLTENPVRLVIPSLNRDITVLNPESRSIADLDAALLSGVVRHPDSNLLGEDGNVFILGHSSYLPSVMNRNFQAFNGVQNMQWGDTLVVYSDTHEYTYQVKKVYQAKASAVTIPVGGVGQRLTIATCNSFGSVDDRHIVEAELVATKAIS